MEQSHSSVSMLDMFMHPVFRVHDGIITEANHAALQRQVQLGASVSEMITAGAEEYDAYSSGCLSLTLQIGETKFLTNIIRTDNGDFFHLQSEYTSPDLRAMALAAQQLREPLANIMAITDRLFSSETLKNDPEAAEKTAQINRGLFQLLRNINNMADISRYSKDFSGNLETRDIASIIDEALLRAKPLVSQTEHMLEYTGPDQVIYCLVDQQMVEQALYNLISNAIKYSPSRSLIRAKLSRSGSILFFTIENEKADISPELFARVFSHFQREPGIEDGQHGLGLGLRMVQSIASIHGGTLLVDRPNKQGIRFTMTLALRQGKGDTLRTPNAMILSGGYDDALIELSDVLPASAYENIN